MSKKEDGVPTFPSVSNQKMMKDWAEEFPGLEVWNEVSMREFILEHDPDYLEKYDEFKSWIMRCDAFRYFVLYHKGGLYVDVDTRLDDAKKLREILSEKRIIILSYDPKIEKPVLKNSFLWADRPGYEFFHRAYNEVDIVTCSVFDAAGPSHLRKVYQSFLDWPSLKNIQDPVSLMSPEELPILHYSNVSWLDDQIWVWLSNHWFWILFLLLILLIAIFLMKPAYQDFVSKTFLLHRQD